MTGVRDGAGDRSRSIVVLQSFPEPRPSTNPYLVQLRNSLDHLPDASVLTFSWQRAVFGRYDVFHAHWPEHMLGASTPARRLATRIAATLFLARLRLTRVPIVRTIHNLGAHESPATWQRRWIDRFDRATAVRIRLNGLTPVDDPARTVTIPHGHYREWFASFPTAPTVPGRFSYFGLIKPYKGVEQLIDAFFDTPGELQLRIGGRPSTPRLGAELRQRAAADPRISWQLGYLSDAELVTLVSSSELVVLPYREMHNSGSALAALSLGRPILVPDNAVNRDLSREVGPGWVQLFAGVLDPRQLLAALPIARDRVRSGRPDLSAREWEDAGRRHLEAYRLAFAVAGRRYSR